MMGNEGVVVNSDVLECGETCTISARVPIKITRSMESLTIRGTAQGVKLLLMCEEGMQPCIGPETNTGQSFGRFSLSDFRLKKLVIDNIAVTCMSNGENRCFSIGTYGVEQVPEIVCINGGSIECPEVHGTRVMVDNIDSYEGSTKHTGSAIYHIVTDNTDKNSLLSDRQRELIEEIYAVNPEVAAQLDFTYSVSMLKSIAGVVKVVNIKDVSAWKKSRNNTTYLMTLRSCAILGIPLDEANHVEYMFECSKSDWFHKKYLISEWDQDAKSNNELKYERAVALAALAYVLTDESVDECFKWEYVYEVIPTYFYSFEPGVPHETNAKKFITSNLIGFDNVSDVPEFKYLNDSVKSDLVTVPVHYSEVLEQFLNRL